MLLIAGETARGKDTLAHYLQNQYGLKPVVSYATRPKRPLEIEGKEHYFITPKEACDFSEKDMIAYTKIGDIEYFATKEELSKDIYIIDPAGIKVLKEKYPEEDFTVIYITTSPRIGMQRALNRGDSVDVVNKRMEAEAKQFEAFTDYDYKFINDGSLEDLYEFGNKIVYEKLITEKLQNLISAYKNLNEKTDDIVQLASNYIKSDTKHGIKLDMNQLSTIQDSIAERIFHDFTDLGITDIDYIRNSVNDEIDACIDEYSSNKEYELDYES